MAVNVTDSVYSMITSICIWMLLFGAYFIMRDVLLQKFRDWGLHKGRIKVILILVILAINVLGVLTFIQARNSEAPGALIFIIKFLKNNLPFTWQNGLWEALTLTLIVCGLSILSFSKRKAYME